MDFMEFPEILELSMEMYDHEKFATPKVSSTKGNIDFRNTSCRKVDSARQNSVTLRFGSISVPRCFTERIRGEVFLSISIPLDETAWNNFLEICLKHFLEIIFS